MSKIIRLNDETERLLNIVRRNLQDGFDKANMHNCDDILKNDNIVIQSALRTAIEFNTYLIESK